MQTDKKLSYNLARLMLLLAVVSVIAGLLVKLPWLYAVAGVSLILSFVVFAAGREKGQNKK